MTDLREVDTASIHLFKDGGDPVTDTIHVLGGDTESVSTGVIDIGLQEHVVDLSVQIDTAVSSVQTTSDPGNPGMLKIIGGGTPGSVKADEESHLLTSIKVVNNSSNGVTCGDGVGSKTSNLFGSSSVADSSRIMPETLGTDPSSGAQTRSREIANVGERDVLLNASVTASTAHGSGTIIGAGVNIVLDHANTIRELVSI